MDSKPVIRYTVDQLQHLRNSPLVRKPDKLPSIEQWMENQGDQNHRKSRPSTSTADHENQRPSILSTRQFARSSAGEDIVLGPPKFAFTSSSAVRIAKQSETGEKSSAHEEDGTNADRYTGRERSFKDRDNERPREKQPYANGRRGPREDVEGWSVFRKQKVHDQDEQERSQRHLGRDRDRNEPDDTYPRKNGAGRGRFEQPWGREDTAQNKDTDNGKFSSTKSTGWRDRERDRDREHIRDKRDDREWNRGRTDDDPEWMATDSAGAEKKHGHTQEDFQRWMKEMKNKTSGRDDVMNAPESVEKPLETSKPTKTSVPPSQTAGSLPPTQLFEGSTEKLFGIWGESKQTSAKDAEITAAPRAAANKSKPSRFASLFSPQEEKLGEEATVSQGTPIAAASVEFADDKAGFQRILQMLGNTTVSPSPVPPKPPLNGNRHRAGLDVAKPNFPPGLEQPAVRHVSTRSKEERDAILDSIIPKNKQSPFGISSPSNNSPWDIPQPSTKTEFREAPINQAPSRNSTNPETGGFQQPLLNRPAAQTDTSNREFLLNLIKQPSRSTSAQTPQNDPGHLVHDNNSLFHGERGTNLQMPKARGPNAGFFDMNDSDMLRRSAELTQHEQPRKPAPRQPPGLYDDPPMSAVSQRRNTNDNPPRLQMSNMGIPQQAEPYWMKNQGIQSPQDRIPPPPGFGNRMHQQQPGGPSFPPHMQFQGNNAPPMGPPPGLNQGLPRSMYQRQEPMGPPPGFFPPGPNGPPGPGLGGPPPGFPHMSMHQDMMGVPRRHAGGPGNFDMFNEMHPGRGRGGPPGPPYM
ncbi:hypothetical protein EJ05DRAFT_139701 [Pseudovirgaria hyperparasitica]|uniref:Uncharacterized protein n=1 Tax=Pseudovirgaria hyperparasitica TaxID=470096 RepID=A0A6A6VXL3_9PEZI|nr:uncharacterized protein EJ05DRAFT_139701 [Pseudovirgaria hyperparasitica]KAF2754380.1 hypothetical protein EJ05DRAFT_139701 [Pseudovirgaria hyperparasitica]